MSSAVAAVYFKLSATFSDELLRRLRIDIISVFFKPAVASVSTLVLVDGIVPGFKAPTPCAPAIEAAAFATANSSFNSKV